MAECLVDTDAPVMALGRGCWWVMMTRGAGVAVNLIDRPMRTYFSFCGIG